MLYLLRPPVSTSFYPASNSSPTPLLGRTRGLFTRAPRNPWTTTVCPLVDGETESSCLGDLFLIFGIAGLMSGIRVSGTGRWEYVVGDVPPI